MTHAMWIICNSVALHNDMWSTTMATHESHLVATHARQIQTIEQINRSGSIYIHRWIDGLATAMDWT